jgi:hypothetical protein
MQFKNYFFSQINKFLFKIIQFLRNLYAAFKPKIYKFHFYAFSDLVS